MYLVYNESGSYKTKTLKGAKQFLDFTGSCGDFGDLYKDMRAGGAWYNDPERCGIEKQDGRGLKDVEYAPTGR